jgi:uncharacterized Tic20 family protein
VRQHAVEALNFNITMLIIWIGLAIAGIILIFTIIGILLLIVLVPLAIALWIYWLVITIVAAIEANRGRPYRYQLSFRLIS